jgi:hypothetical protein
MMNRPTEAEFTTAYVDGYLTKFSPRADRQKAEKQASELHTAISFGVAGGFQALLLRAVIDALPKRTVSEKVLDALGGSGALGALTNLVENGIVTLDQVKGAY